MSANVLAKQDDPCDSAPIEIKKKDHPDDVRMKDQILVQSASDAARIKQEREEQEKMKMKMNITKLFRQLKQGCDKPICFNKYCKMNPFERQFVQQTSQSDEQLLKFVIKSLKEKSHDFLFCQTGETI